MILSHEFDFSDKKEKRKTIQDIQAEYWLIGWVLCDNSLMNHIYFLSKDAFSYPRHAEIWESMKALNNKGEPISPFTLKPLLPDDDYSIPTLEYLAKSISNSWLTNQPFECAKYLENIMHQRNLEKACEPRDGGEALEERALRLNTALRAIEERSLDGEFQDNLTVADGIVKDLTSGIKPYATGLLKLDHAMDGGLYPGKSYGFAARKKVGKTALAATLSANLNQAGVKHLFICGEMSPKEIHQRVLARKAGIYPTAFRTGYGESGDCQEKLMRAIKDMPRNTLYKNAPGMTFEQLRQICTIAVEKHYIKGFILDYWQLVGGKQRNQSEASHLDEVAQWIADFGRSHNIWTITMAQINQEGNTRGGEGIRLAFDQLYQIHRDVLTLPDTWIEMMETRYTPWANIGSKEIPGLLMNEKGPFFEEI